MVVVVIYITKAINTICLNASRPSEHPTQREKRSKFVIVSHIQRNGCQPEKHILHGFFALKSKKEKGTG